NDRLDLREVNLKTHLPEFIELYKTMLTRKQFVDHHKVEALPDFALALTPALNARLFLAYCDGRPVAGSLTIGPGERVFVAFSASDEQALELRAGYALRWFIINRLRGSGARWLDLGGAEGDSGLRHFKSGNVGKRGRVAVFPGEFDFPGSWASTILAR